MYFMPGREPIVFSDAAALVRLGRVGPQILDIAQAEGLRLVGTGFTTRNFTPTSSIGYPALQR